MSRDLVLKPLGRWPGELTKYRKVSNFKAGFSSTMDILDRELWAVNAGAVVVQLAVHDRDVKGNGSLRATARPDHPGVVVSFTSPRLGKVRFTCDRFTDWQDNLRAIALGMEALRKVDRYGITSDGQQYAGFRAIEAAETARAFETVEDAATFIATHALDAPHGGRAERIAAAMLDDDELVDTYYRRAAKRAHPDAGGDDTTMARLTVARAMLDEAQR